MNIKGRYLILLLVLVVLTIYYPSLFAPVNSVDDNAMEQGLWNLGHVDITGLFFPGGNGYYYRPLLSLSFIVDRFAWGLQECIMHLENVLLHAANTVLVFLISVHVFRRYRLNDRILPLVAALLFALHPINTESVNWLSGRSDLLGGLFLLSSLLVEIIALERKRLLLALPAALLFIAGCLSKDTVVFAFPAFLLLIFCFDATQESSRTSFFRHLYEKSGFYLLNCLSVAVYFFMRHLAFSKGDGGISLAGKGIAGTDYDTLNKLRIVLKTFGFYCKKLLIPLPLNFAIIKISDLYLILGIAAIIVCCWFLLRPTVGKVLILFSAAVLSPSFLVPLGKMAWTPYAERYLYMPAATFSIAITLLAAKMLFPSGRVDSKKWLTVTVFFLLSGMAYATTTRNIVWQDNLTLYQDTLAKTPDFAPVLNELATALQAHGRNDAARKMFDSISLPDTEKYHVIVDLNRAVRLASQGNPEGARKLLLSKPCDKSNNYYQKYLTTIIDLDMKIIEKSKSSRLKAERGNEITEIIQKLYDCTKDPFYYYRAGQQYLSMKMTVEAQRYFRLAYENAPKDAYYSAAAKKLSLKLL